MRGEIQILFFDQTTLHINCITPTSTHRTKREILVEKKSITDTKIWMLYMLMMTELLNDEMRKE